MAMYTDLELNVRLSLKMPEQLIAVLSNPGQLNDDNVKELAQYRFFQCDHCIQLLTFPLDDKKPPTVFKALPAHSEFTLQTTFINYDDELTHFMELLRPYIIAKEDELLGETKYEESLNYVEIWLRDGKLSYEVRDSEWLNELQWTLGYGGQVTTNSLLNDLIKDNKLTNKKAANLLSKKTGRTVKSEDIQCWTTQAKNDCPDWALIALRGALELWYGNNDLAPKK